MDAVPIETSMAMAARNEIVRHMGECTIPLLVLHYAIEKAEHVRAQLSKLQPV